jgi:hypothetical protein
MKRINKEDKEYQLIIDWLCNEYSLEEAEEQVNEAFIIKEDDNTITIRYDNGVEDKVMIVGENVIHLNPFGGTK